MKRFSRKFLLNSFMHKLLGIIILLAMSVLLTIYLFSNIIFLNAQSHFIFLRIGKYSLFSLKLQMEQLRIVTVHQNQLRMRSSLDNFPVADDKDLIDVENR